MTDNWPCPNPRCDAAPIVGVSISEEMLVTCCHCKTAAPLSFWQDRPRRPELVFTRERYGRSRRQVIHLRGILAQISEMDTECCTGSVGGSCIESLRPEGYCAVCLSRWALMTDGERERIAKRCEP